MAFFCGQLKTNLSMGAITNNNSLSSKATFSEVVANFFKCHTLDSAYMFKWKIFQCWTLNDCDITSDIPNEEIALFLDQLTDLVAAAYILHQANRVPNAGQQGELET
jgi:hypothetical protein